MSNYSYVLNHYNALSSILLDSSSCAIFYASQKDVGISDNVFVVSLICDAYKQYIYFFSTVLILA